MICSNCGQILDDGTKYCGSCGAPQAVTSTQQVIPITPDPTPVVDKYAQEPAVPIVPSAAGRNNTVNDENVMHSKETICLIMGILSLALSWTLIGGIILGITGCNIAKDFKEVFYEFTPKAKTGKILSIVGIATSVAIVISYFMFGIIGNLFNL